MAGKKEKEPPKKPTTFPSSSKILSHITWIVNEGKGGIK
jgi:hypothetical protein